ncbi:MAG: hypothetical protein RL300_209 [Pseudomonadota bacterium]
MNELKSIVLKRISVPKAQDILADQLRADILRGLIAEGASLPPERTLVEQTGLSRGSVRAALRTLAVEGLVETRPGRFGGNVVTLPGKEALVNSIEQFVRGRRLPLRTLQETRDALEPALARLAAVHRTEADLLLLKSLHADLVAAVDHFPEFSLANIQWHKAVAAASQNDLLATFLYAISYGVVVSTTTEEYDTMDTRQQVIKIHSRINEAIEAGDADLAERRMRQHIGATHERATALDATNIPLSDENQ